VFDTEQVTNLARALRFFEERAVSLGDNFDDIKARLESLDQLKATLEEAKKSGVSRTDQQIGNISDQERRRLQESGAENSQLSKLVGSISSPQFEAQLSSVYIQINEVREAGARGLISKYEMTTTVEKLESRYVKGRATLEAYQFGGAFAGKATQAIQNAPAATGTFITNQVEGVTSGIMGKIAALPVAGGLFGLMAYGFVDRNRLDAQAAGLANILAAEGGALNSDLTASLNAFTERGEKFLGISKSEIQSAVGAAVRAGAGTSEILRGGKTELGDVGENLITLTTALDKHYQVASGSTMDEVLQLWKGHGENISKATDQVLRLDAAAERAGAGIADFSQFAVKVSTDLANYGVSGIEVGAALIDVQHEYMGAGLSAQAAMSFAKAGMAEVAKGLQGLNRSVRIKLGEMVNPHLHGLEAGQKIQDSWSEEHGLEKTLTGLNTLAEQQTSGSQGTASSEVKKRAWLEAIGLGFNGSELIVKLAEKYHGHFELAKMTVKEQDELKNTFTNQSKTMGEVYSGVKQMLQGMSNMGQGLMGMITNFVGLSIVTIRGLMTLDMLDVMSTMGKAAWNSVAQPLGQMIGIDLGIDQKSFSRHGAQWERVSAAISKQQEQLSVSSDQFQHGFSQTMAGGEHVAGHVGGAAYEEASVVAKSVTRTVSSAMGFGDRKSEGIKALEHIAIQSHYGPQSGLTDEFLTEGSKVAERLGIPFDELLLAMTTESGIKASTHARLDKSVVGLLQFTPSTLKALGWTGTADEFASLSELQQLPWVEKFLKPYAKQGITSDARIHQALALPASLSIGKNRDDIILRKGGTGYHGEESKIYDAYQNDFDHEKRGYITVGDFEKTDLFWGKKSTRFQYAISRLHQLGMLEDYTASAEITETASGKVIALKIDQTTRSSLTSVVAH
jgi:hypothetical protein